MTGVPAERPPPTEPTADPGLLEELAANAVPASTVWLLDGWLVRHTPEWPFERANSVVPLAHHGRTPIDDKLAVVEECYRHAGRPVRYQISPASQPADLDDRLEVAGYERVPGIEVRTGPVARVLETTATGLARTARFHATTDDRWVAAWRGCDDAEGPVRAFGESYAGVLRRIGPPLAAISLELDGRPASVAFGVVERGWVGVLGLLTRADAYGHGAATAVVHAVAAWAHRLGATRLYLQMPVEATRARTLADRWGLEPAYVLHYRVTS
ncbi:MAG: hypothetical protein M5U14_21275 [Acidimicrobiia bacterium]|nr:hypothetical protein [Acidimicrobiia bacterium]